ncbi:MAG: reactive intermediate/imine deaminase [Oscillospiraceae bacterium]|nr:MAG: reactive intermediate/imine deaminase [Oscillospiraceae bacterium]
MKQQINVANAPAAIGPYSQGILSGNLAFLSGQLPINPATKAMPEGITAQAKQSLENVKAVLAGEGFTLQDVVKTTVYLQNMDDFAAMNAVYAEYFSTPFPARSAFEVARLPMGALVEIECIACKG